MADHTSITDTTPQPTVETPPNQSSGSSPEPAPPFGTAEPPQALTPYYIRGRVNQSLPSDRWKTRLALFTKIILQTFAGHTAKRHYKPRNQRRIRQIILHGAHADEQMITRKGEPYMMLVTVNKLPHDIDTLLATITAIIHARWGMHVHIHLMRARQFKRGFRRASPFYKALTVCSEVLYSDGGNHPIMPPVVMAAPVLSPGGAGAEAPIMAKVITPDKRPERKPDHPEKEADEPAETPAENPDDKKPWWDAPDMRGYKAAYDREHGGLSTDDIMMDMEEPIVRLNDAAVLLTDLAYGGMHDVPPRAKGLDFIAQALTRDARLLYRLYNGHAPNYH